jgi:hypothetical protein
LNLALGSRLRLEPWARSSTEVLGDAVRRSTGRSEAALSGVEEDGADRRHGVRPTATVGQVDERIRVDDDTLNALRHLARSQDRAVSDVVRAALSRCLAAS